MISSEEWAAIDWDDMRTKSERSWRRMLLDVLESARESLAEGDTPAARVAQARLSELLAETRGAVAYREVIAATKAVLEDLARAKFLHSARKLATVTASIVVRVRPLGKASKQFDQASARIELRKWISGLDLAKKVLERLEVMKDAAFGDNPNIAVFMTATKGLIADLEAADRT